MRRLGTYLFCTLLCSCAAPRQGYVLTHNRIETDKSAPRDERITADEIDRFIRLSPVRKLRLGAPPVMLDSALVLRSVRNIEGYVRSRGFYDSRLDWRVDFRGRRARVTYAVTQGEPYRIGSVDYRFRDTTLRAEVLADTASRLVRTGGIFDIGTLGAERSRVADRLRDRGYYDLTVNNVEYLADSARGNKTVDLTLVVRKNQTGYGADGEPVFEDNVRYRLGEIFLDPSGETATDTLHYRGLNILSDGHLRVRERVLRRAVALRTGQIYNASAVEEAYSDIVSLGYFRSASIVFSEADSLLTTRINCTPALRQSVRADVEGSLSSNFMAVGATLGYQNRNLFRGAELLDISLTGRYEFLRATARTSSYEIGGAVSVTWPRLLAPPIGDNRPRDPRTRLEASLNYQDRPIYRRTLSGVRLSYTWSDRRGSTLVYRPVDVNLIDVNYIDAEFLQQLRNPYLRSSYRSQVVPGMSFSWVRRGGTDAGAPTLRLEVETMGNLFAAAARLTSRARTDPATGDRYYNALGLRFSQYARAEASIADRIATGHRTAFVWRVLAGGAASYANSTAIPVDRLFYSGGSNSMRGWIVRRLGPGTLPNDDKNYPSQVGNLKLEANVEFRFPVWDFVHSAVFVDMGNIWFTGRGDYEEAGMNDAAIFRFGRFYRQLGLNTGLGARLDFGRFIFRADWGVKLHDPGRAAGDRWIRTFRLRNTALNFGVGYPF